MIKKKINKKILLLDGYNLFYRARYSGMNKGDHSTVFNFFRSLRPLIEKMDPDEAFLVLEGVPRKRLDVDAEYKGQRIYTDNDNFNHQRNEIIRILKEHFPITIVKHEDYECDDVIAHLARFYESNNNVTIISSDTDFIQSITDNTRLYNPIKKSYLEKPEYDYVVWKSLVGDKSDNIDGFKGIGNKRALKLMSSKEELDNFINESTNKEKFEKNKFMIKFHDLGDDALDVSYTRAHSSDNSWSSLRELFRKFEFASMTEKDKTWNKYVSTFNKLQTKENVK